MSKHITMEDWQGSFDKIAQPGDTVDEEIAMHFLNCLPPLVQRRDYFQCSEPVYGAYKAFLHRDYETGQELVRGLKPYPTYATFYKNNQGVWVYAGNCFRGECTHRLPVG